MKSVYIQRMMAMPGPIWLFGAYAVHRLVQWCFPLLLRVVNGRPLWYEGRDFGLDLCNLASAILPLVVLWTLLVGKPFSLFFARWYADARILLHFLGLLSLLYHGYDPVTFGGYEDLVRFIASHLMWCGLWLAFLLYLERSKSLVEILPAQARRGSWWLIAVIIVLALHELFSGLTVEWIVMLFS